MFTGSIEGVQANSNNQKRCFRLWQHGPKYENVLSFSQRICNVLTAVWWFPIIFIYIHSAHCILPLFDQNVILASILVEDQINSWLSQQTHLFFTYKTHRNDRPVTLLLFLTELQWGPKLVHRWHSVAGSQTQIVCVLEDKRALHKNLRGLWDHQPPYKNSQWLQYIVHKVLFVAHGTHHTRLFWNPKWYIAYWNFTL